MATCRREAAAATMVADSGIRMPALEPQRPSPAPRRGDLRLVLVAFLALLLGFAAWAMLRGAPDEPLGVPTLPDDQGAEPAAPATARGGDPEAMPGEVRADGGGEAAEVAPPQPDRFLIGVVRRQGRGVPDVRVAITAGLDRGLDAVTGPDGTYRVGPLWCDAAVARFVLGGTVLAERPFVMRFGRETRLDVDATPGPLLAGRIVDWLRRPVVGAVVRCDGAEVASGADGGFALQRLASGPARVRVEHPDFAPRDLAPWTEHARTIELRPGGAIEVTVPGLAAAGEAQVYVLPRAESGASDWPVALPVTASPGTTVTLANLPGAEVEVRAFHVAAHAEVARATVRAGAVARVALTWRSLPVLAGRVRDPEGPVVGAAVELRVGDPQQALAIALGGARGWLRHLPFAPLPAARQQAVTGPDGRFSLFVPDLPRGQLFVSAVDAARRVARRLPAAAGEVELALPGAPQKAR